MLGSVTRRIGTRAYRAGKAVCALLSADRRYAQQVARWQSDGTLPDELERDYRSSRVRRRDVRRMQALGYSVTRVENVGRMYTVASVGGPVHAQKGRGVHVVFRRQAISAQAADGLPS